MYHEIYEKEIARLASELGRANAKIASLQDEVRSLLLQRAMATEEWEARVDGMSWEEQLLECEKLEKEMFG